MSKLKLEEPNLDRREDEIKRWGLNITVSEDMKLRAVYTQKAYDKINELRNMIGQVKYGNLYVSTKDMLLEEDRKYIFFKNKIRKINSLINVFKNNDEYNKKFTKLKGDYLRKLEQYYLSELENPIEPRKLNYVEIIQKAKSMIHEIEVLLAKGSIPYGRAANQRWYAQMMVGWSKVLSEDTYGILDGVEFDLIERQRAGYPIESSWNI